VGDPERTAVGGAMSGQRIARIAVFAALVAVLGLTPAISVPGISVPITAQTLGVMIAGLMLVPLEAFLSLVLFVGLVAAGLPLLSGGRGGLGVFSTGSAGFVLGFPVAAAVVSFIILGLRTLGGVRRPAVQLATHFVAAVLGGVVALYCIGIPVGSAVADIPLGTFFRASMTFLPGDVVKAAAATVVATSAFRAAPFLRPQLAKAAR
jgi:biotin transport system substrate-specific component